MNGFFTQSDGQDKHQRRAREAGFDAYVTKPINFDELERILAALGRDEAASRNVLSMTDN